MTMVRRLSVLSGFVVGAALVAALVQSIGVSAEPAAAPSAALLPASHVDDFAGKPRLLVLSDIGNEPDDQMSLVRLLMYCNEIDIEGLVATTSTWQREAAHPETMRELIAAYGEVRPNLLKHAPGWPEASRLDALVASGQPAYGMAAVGTDRMSAGAQLVVRAADRDDPRPLWVSVWGGANTLAQALSYVRSTRTPADVDRLIAKLRVYSISDQDDAGPWIRREFPGLFYIVKPSTPDGDEYYSATWIGISGEGWYRSFQGADLTTITNEWLDANIRSKGPLGKHYPRWMFIMEGDTPAYLGLTNNGLNSYRNPSWGGWSGRYNYRTPYGETRPIWTQGGDAGRVNSQDAIVAADGRTYSSDQATIWRWREAYQHDFAARMDWTVKGYAEANHNPVVVVNGQKGTGPIAVSAPAGQPVVLDASGTTDPDRHQLRYTWFHYAEAGAAAGPQAQVKLDGADTAKATVTPSAGGRGRGGPGGGPAGGAAAAHIILAVTDNGSPSLTSYRRVILSVAGGTPPAQRSAQAAGGPQAPAGQQPAGIPVAAGGVRQAGAQPPQAAALPAPSLAPLGPDRTITEADCTTAKLGSTIPVSAIGEPVSAVTLSAPRWVAATAMALAHCEVDGSMAPIDKSATAKPINFRVWLPASWNHRSAQQGGGGNNGVIPDLNGAGYSIGGRSPAALGFVTYGSDSGHQMAFGGMRGGPMPARGGAPGAAPGAAPGGARGAMPPQAGGPGAPPDARGMGGAPPGGQQGGLRAAGPPGGASAADDWALNDEAMRNLGHLQLKKTHDAAMVLIERLYGERPRYNYFTGTSQGGREALTVAQRYPADYNGVISNVPIVNFSSLMLAPVLIRIQEKPLANWVTRAKVNAIRGEFMRQCDSLDGLVDGVIDNYMACRAIFDVGQGAPGRHPWAAKRCPNNIDPNPEDTSPDACLTDGQIATLEFVYSRLRFKTPLANGVTSFGMWLPNVDPSGSGLIQTTRFKGQEGAAPDAPNYTHLGIVGVTAFLMRDLAVNPLDYREEGAVARRRAEISPVLDSTNPDLSPFAKRGGKMIVTIGTDDTLASPGAQLDYYQSVIDKMGQAAVDSFARFFVIPQAGHGLSGRSYTIDGEGKALTAQAIPNSYERFAVLLDWVERGVVPDKSLTVRAGDRTKPLCSYPTYPRYTAGPPEAANSYTCAAR